MILVLIKLYASREDLDKPVRIHSLARASAAHTRELEIETYMNLVSSLTR